MSAGPQVFLRVSYTTGPEVGSYDHVGPFPDAAGAEIHRDTFGPAGAELVELSPSQRFALTPMSAAAHILAATARA